MRCSILQAPGALKRCLSCHNAEALPTHSLIPLIYFLYIPLRLKCSVIRKSCLQIKRLSELAGGDSVHFLEGRCKLGGIFVAASLGNVPDAEMVRR